MRDISILHDLLKKQCPNLHAKRFSSLMIVTQSLLDAQQLSLKEFGRNISGSLTPKHNIKRIEILLGNTNHITSGLIFTVTRKAALRR
tara:strand:- start:673 stop:936 length:264 start_codon:yes stop_codon:yes gene_type:complete